MPNKQKKHPSNVGGKFFCTDQSDESGCIACGVCYSNAPDHFEYDDDGYAFVKKQPATPEEVELCQEQRESCPVESIGDDGE